MRALLLVVIFPFLLGCGKGESNEELNLINIRLNQVEERIVQPEGTEKKTAHLGNKIEKLERSISEMNKLMASRTKEERYHEVRQGDSLFKIAQKNGIKTKELCFLNKITSKTVIRPGQKLLITR